MMMMIYVHCRMKASPTDTRLLLSCAVRIRSLPLNFFISSLHRVIGRLLPVPPLGSHSITLVVHCFSVLCPACPVELHPSLLSWARNTTYACIVTHCYYACVTEMLSALAQIPAHWPRLQWILTVGLVELPGFAVTYVFERHGAHSSAQHDWWPCF